jgi:hypothetical protein
LLIERLWLVGIGATSAERQSTEKEGRKREFMLRIHDVVKADASLTSQAGAS